MVLNSKQRRQLRSLAHPLKAVVQIGQQGLTHALVRQVEQALDHHELIKVQVGQDMELTRKEAAAELAKEAGAELVQVIGRMVVLYRKHPEEPKIELS